MSTMSESLMSDIPEQPTPAEAGTRFDTIERAIADIAAGMYAYSGILSALLLRERTGEGSRVEVSMLESLVEWMGYPLYYAYAGMPPPARAGAGRRSRNHAARG